MKQLLMQFETIKAEKAIIIIVFFFNQYDYTIPKYNYMLISAIIFISRERERCHARQKKQHLHQALLVCPYLTLKPGRKIKDTQ